MIMKKYILMIASLLTLGMAAVSCDTMTNEPEGGNQIGPMAGNWVVTLEALDENGKVVDDDPYGASGAIIEINTFANTNGDTDKMWFSDQAFWGLMFQVPVNKNDNTFEAKNVPYDQNETGNVTIKGKVLPKAGKNIHGLPVDSIYVEASFDDDDSGLVWRYAGTRYQGFTE